MVGWLVTLIGAATSLIDPISRITTNIAKEKEKVALAESDYEINLIQERIKTLKLRRDVLIKDKNPGNTFIRMLYAVPPGIYFAKLWIWDKVLDLGATDPITDESMKQVLFAVLGLYFLYEIVNTWKKK